MAVHPFARKCEEVIEYLRKILANIKKTKKTVKEKEPKKGKAFSIFDLPQIQLLGSHEMEQQGFTTGSTAGLRGDIDNSGPKKKPIIHKTGDPMMDKLLKAYNEAMEKCRDKNMKENEAYFRCRARARQDGVSDRHCQADFVQMQCPEGVAAREALDAYSKSRNGNSGGGGGGGF